MRIKKSGLHTIFGYVKGGLFLRARQFKDALSGMTVALLFFKVELERLGALSRMARACDF